MKYFGIQALAAILMLLPWPKVIAPVIIALSLMVQAYVIGQRFVPNQDHGLRILLGFLYLTSLVAVVGTIFFYLYKLDSLVFILLTFSPLLLWLLPPAKQMAVIQQEPASPKSAVVTIIIAVVQLLYVAAVSMLLISLLRQATVEAVATPWSLVGPVSFWLYATATALLIILCYWQAPWHKLCLILHSFLSFGLVLLLYPLGFGYDPFIHQATEQIILATGTLEPKPPYYIGYYSLVVWLTHYSRLTIATIDNWLLPTISSLSLMPLIWYTFRYNFRVHTAAVTLLPLALYILPYGTLIQSTPQGLSFLWSLIIIIVSIFYINNTGVTLWHLLLLAAATAVMHPLTGIPIFFFVLTLGLYHRFWQGKGIKKYLRLSIYWLGVIAASIALPAVFLINTFADRGQNKILAASETSLQLLNGSYHRYIRWEDLLYLWHDNQRLIIFALALGCGLILLRRRKARYFMHYAVIFVALICNYILLKLFVTFDFLISYERYVFPERILALSLYLLFPYILLLMYWYIEKALQASRLIQLSTLLFVVCLSTAAWYLAYPRFDYYDQNKGYNSSLYDQLSVQMIQQQEGTNEYVVLANQSTSAMAIRTFGFSRYYQGHFYYPVPTSGPLYDLYLDLVYNKKTASEVVAAAQKLTGVSTVYLVLNNYWSGYEDIVAREIKRSQSYSVVGDEKTYIFRYQADQSN